MLQLEEPTKDSDYSASTLAVGRGDPLWKLQGLPTVPRCAGHASARLKMVSRDVA